MAQTDKYSKIADPGYWVTQIADAFGIDSLGLLYVVVVIIVLVLIVSAGVIAKEIIAEFTRHFVQKLLGKQDGATDDNFVSIARLPITGEHLFGRDEELRRLDNAWADERVNVINLVAWGGVGKSALVNRWLANLAEANYRGAKRVYGISFYSQGTRETSSSADTAIDAALRQFGDSDPAEGSPWDKGERLARLVQEKRTLLILDGLEPLQNPPGPDAGRLKDPALHSLILGLAASNQGLCVITTRHRVADIDHFSQTTAPVIELENLSEAAGATMLRKLGVEGGEDELQQASSEFDGHSLALNLLGTYLYAVYNGDVGRRDEVTLLEDDAAQGGHAKRMMRSYENWFGEGPELAVLRIIGLFDRPAAAKAVAAMRHPPSIAGLTDALQDMTDANWHQTLARLRQAKLLAERDPTDPDALDAHPLVREHFGQQLNEYHPDAWREGSRRLYEHFRDTAMEFPDTLEEMTPLLQAVYHGCQAGDHQEVLFHVYFKRIARCKQLYLTNTLGAYGAALAALAGLFNPPWEKPVPTLSEENQSFVLNEVGYYLRTVGRLVEAGAPIREALKMHVKRKAWLKARVCASNLSELYLAMGKVGEAVAMGESSVAYADKSNSILMRRSARTVLAYALHHAGEQSRAKELFEEADKLQAEGQPEFPMLYGPEGYYYCDFLLTLDCAVEVQNRAAYALKISTTYLGSLAVALDHLSLGRAAQSLGEHERARAQFGQSVEGLRQAGQQDYLARGLLARASLFRETGNIILARRDLEETKRLARRGPMKLLQCDAYLEYARLALAENLKKDAVEHVAQARRLLDESGYGRRRSEMENLTTDIG